MAPPCVPSVIFVKHSNDEASAAVTLGVIALLLVLMAKVGIVLNQSRETT